MQGSVAFLVHIRQHAIHGGRLAVVSHFQQHFNDFIVSLMPMSHPKQAACVYLHGSKVDWSATSHVLCTSIRSEVDEVSDDFDVINIRVAILSHISGLVTQELLTPAEA